MIPLAGPQGLFTRLGLIFGCHRSAVAQVGATMPPKVDALRAQYATSDQATADGIYAALAGYQSSPSQFSADLQSLARDTVVGMANDDMPQTSNVSLSVALQYVIDQMIASSASVARCLASGSVVAAPGNAGDAVCRLSFLSPAGVPLENVFNESISVTTSRDSQSGGLAPGSEVVTMRGQYAAADPLSFAWPVGSGSAASAACVYPAGGPSTGTNNYLNNSDFETSANQPGVPDGWFINSGNPNISMSSGVAFTGLWSVAMAGDGVTRASISQAFGALPASGTPIQPLPHDNLAFNAFLCVAPVPASGSFSASLLDENNFIINDESGNANNITVDLTTLASGQWTPFGGYFRLPRVLPSSIRLQLGLSTAMAAGATLYVDRAAMAEPSQSYPGGPYVAFFSGATPLILGDQYIINIHNNYSGQFQRYFERFFGMRRMGLSLPSSVTPTISDSLID